MSLGINYTGVQSFNLYRIEGNYVLPPQTRGATIKNRQHAGSTVIIPRTYGIGEAGEKHLIQASHTPVTRNRLRCAMSFRVQYILNPEEKDATNPIKEST